MSSDVESQAGSQIYEFNPDSFEFIKDGDKLILGLKQTKKEIARERVQQDPDDEKKTGCPAIPTKAIPEMHEWLLGLAETYYLPALVRESKVQ